MYKKKLPKINLADDIRTIQTDRIEELKSENDDLKKRIKDYELRESSIADALLIAQKTASAYESETKLRFMLECNRLDNYRSQWLGLIDNLTDAEKLGEEILRTHALLDQCARDMHKIITKEFGNLSVANQTYIKETERLSRVLSNLNTSQTMPKSELQRLIDEFANSFE
ncbi:MAG: hypothetical protein LBF12_06965 [Christensenellaceae bacterium]|jgi:cell division septum initiation protein DivIVA|nr:hypothetical protein [Christensenellaceae bacterium]